MANSFYADLQVNDFSIARAFNNDGELMSCVLNEMQPLDGEETEKLLETLSDNGREVLKQLYKSLRQEGLV